MEMLLLLLFMVSASMSMDPPYIRWKLLGPHIYKPWTLPIQDWGTTLVNLNNWVLVWTQRVSKPPSSLLTCRRTHWSQQEELTCSFLLLTIWSWVWGKIEFSNPNHNHLNLWQFQDAAGHCVAARSMDPGTPVDCPPCDPLDPLQTWVLHLSAPSPTKPTTMF